MDIYSTSCPRHGTEPLYLSCYPPHRRTEETQEQEKYYNNVHLCTAHLSVWLYFYNVSQLSKQHNSILRKKNLLLYDLIWARKTTKRSDHCRTATSMKAKKINPFAGQVDCTTPAAHALLSCSHRSCYTSSTPVRHTSSQSGLSTQAQAVQTRGREMLPILHPAVCCQRPSI